MDYVTLCYQSEDSCFSCSHIQSLYGQISQFLHFCILTDIWGMCVGVVINMIMETKSG